MSVINIYLISDSTGETVYNVAKAVLAQFEGVIFKEHFWPMVRSERQIIKALNAVSRNPGIVMYTVAEKELRLQLKEGCAKIGVKCIPVLAGIITEVSSELGIKPIPKAGKQHETDEDYFKRIEAIDFSLSHDDGQSIKDLNEADIVLIGASRTSKSPTSIYLSYRGYKTANIPFILGCQFPEQVFSYEHPLVIGLTASVERLADIRRNRILSISEEKVLLDNEYTNSDRIKEEIIAARKMFTKFDIPIIDVTKRSVEETAATILQHYHARQTRMNKIRQNNT
jgi:regulator of PEP synthase PpsR (kinase-PPPase family)